MIRIWYCRNDRLLSPDEWEALLSEVPETMHPGILRFERWQDRQAGLFGKLMMARAFAPSLPADLFNKLAYNGYKRPYLPGYPDFNLSHSGEWIVLAVAESGRIGIDIEELRPVRIGDFRSVLHPDEQERLRSLPDPSELFFSIWTKKEAVIKAEGKGLYNALDTVVALTDKVWLEGEWWWLRPLALAEGYCCHLAADREITGMQVQRLDFFK